MNEEEKILLEKAKTGDVEAYEELVKSHYTIVYNIALRMLSNTHDASDLAQEVFIKIFKSIKNFEGKSSFKTWIYRITINLCYDEYKKKKHISIVSYDEQIENKNDDYGIQTKNEIKTPEKSLLDSEIKGVLNDAINKLPKNLKIVVVLRDIQGFSYEEIAQILKCPQGTVKSRINRAREHLRKELSGKTELF